MNEAQIQADKTVRHTKTLSVQVKIFLAVVITFIVVLAMSMALIASSQRDLAREIGEAKAHDLARTFFDGVNTMMITGTLDQQEGLRTKFLSQTGVEDVRIVASATHFPNLAKGTLDELDQQAMNGKEVVQAEDGPQGRAITVALPIIAASNYLGTNCLSCHQVPEGTVLGVARARYSLGPLDAQFNQSLLLSGGVNLLLSLAGIGVVVYLLRHIVLARLRGMRDTMAQIEANSDLGARLAVRADDEVDQLARGINHMLDNFRSSLAQVAATGHRVAEVAERVSAVSHQTTTAAALQRDETDAARSLIDELQHLAGDVGQSAEATAQTSVEADQRATESMETTRQAIKGILALVEDLKKASEAIAHLDERSRNVSGVLEVIQGIAEQTNLLALNAAIEAARAGEAGRGFAVVADEVRNLASRSHTSARSIEEIVSQLQDEARRTVDTMDLARSNAEHYTTDLEAAASSLNNIVERVGNIRSLNTNMAKAVNQQGQLTQEVNQRVGTISGIADRTSNDALETQAVSEELVSLSHELNTLVNRFKLG
ncbi:MAG: HAMP domain-containing methyl-accepting chemotaxis protein [Pseudomonadota bacterium]